MAKRISETLSPLTVKDWRERLGEIDNNATYFYGYLDGTERPLKVVETIVEKAHSFDELKKDIMNFVYQQQDFLDDAQKRLRDDPYLRKIELRHH
ncbi:hypothetical protein [Niabella hibiscisoli]|uniref:hypothetical protein n=1 Tax=Niabella hibiscisoli TaxID=1825928 RepID=UPI001F0DE18A|nr:hypothetical protein [Niabella hibiscisoli]MCH5716705.1 hypothetical protein [Niabella hibiscisoli]